MPRKTVYNSIGVGLNLPYKAVMKYAELKELSLWAGMYDENWGGNHGGYTFKEYDPDSGNGATYFLDGSKNEWNPEEIGRDDPCLVQVVELTGEQLKNEITDLKIKEIPDGAKSKIVILGEIGSSNHERIHIYL